MQFRHRITSILVGCGAISMLVACGEDETREKYLGLETPSDGFQVRSQGAPVEVGQDIEYCEVAELPGTPDQTYYVRSVELGNGLGSHHLIVSAATPGSRAEANLLTKNIGDKVQCLGAEQAFGQGFEGIDGIQQPYGRLDYPDGIGRVYHGKQRIVFDYHYLNLTKSTVMAKSALNIHLTDAAHVTHIASVFGFTNWTIDTPPGKTGSFTAECHFKNDVKIAGLTRHTHRWGTDYSVWYSGGARDGEHIWTSTNWEHDVDHPFSEPIVAKAGEGFRFQCNYNNTEQHALRFGTNASDEMCILFGLIWDAGDARTVPSQSCGITWTDDAGIGHPASEDGGFPKPPDDLVNACLGGAGPSPTDQVKCQCSSCATQIIKCYTDPDCKAILDCAQNGCGDDCANVCQPVIDQHSSAVGLVTQLNSCVTNRCPKE